jgi:hypothetical protein
MEPDPAASKAEEGPIENQEESTQLIKQPPGGVHSAQGVPKKEMSKPSRNHPEQQYQKNLWVK